MGNTRLPTVDSRVDGTSNAEVDDDRSPVLSTRHSGDWLKGISQVGRTKFTDALIHRDRKLEGYLLQHTKPMQVVEHWGIVI